jgi:ADP-ribose pyrophosphatase
MSDEVLFESKRLRVVERDDWQFVERITAKEAVAIVAVTQDDRVILIEQERKPLQKRVIDYPAGLIGDEDQSESVEDSARRELEEETGYRCERVERLATGPSSPGITSEIVHIYRAYGLEKVGKGGGVEGENITVHAVPRREMREWLARKEREGLMIDLKIWGGFYFLES